MHLSSEWSFNIAYNAMQQAGRALMLYHGYRSVGSGHHLTVIQFLKISFETKFNEIFILMDRMRRQRNQTTYETVGITSEKEARAAIINAKELVSLVTDSITEVYPLQND